MKRITMKDLAKEAGVSVATVSLVLNNKAEHLSATTIERVESLAQKLGFVSNIHARSLKTKQSQTIGLILPDITNHFFTRMAKSIERYLSQAGYLLLLSNTDGVDVNEIEAIKRFLQLHVERVILVASHTSTYQFIEEHRLTHFVIFLDRIMAKKSFWWVESDDYGGGRLAAQEFIHHNHYDVICVTGPSHFTNVQERLEGFKDAYEELGRSYNIVYLEGDFTVASGNRLAQTIIACRHRAIFFMNDLMAMGFYRACVEAGIVIRDNYSIIGYDDLEFALYLDPPLTTIQQPIDAMAHRVMQFIQEKNEYAHEKLPVQLIKRQSVYMAKETEK